MLNELQRNERGEKMIDYEIAYNAHRGTSFYPEKRALQEQEGFLAHVKSVKEELNNAAKTPAQKELALSLGKRYEEKYLRLKTDYLRSRANCLSTMIAGPANFNVKRAEKANNAERNKLDNLLNSSEALRKKYLNLIAKERFVDKSELEETKEKLEVMEKLQEGMKKANRLLKKLSKQGATINTFNELFEVESVESGISVNFMIENARWNTPPHKGYESFRLTNNNALIKRLKAKVEKLEALENATDKDNKETCFDGFSVVENKEADRLQFIFDGKPDENIRTILKSYAFRWSPKNSAWQRKLTNNAIYAGNSAIKEIQEVK